MKRVHASEMLDRDYLKQPRQADRPETRAATPKPGAPQQRGTVYLTAADETGMMVSYIQSNFKGFGSGVVVPNTGIALQNRGFGFTLKEGHPNQVGAGQAAVPHHHSGLPHQRAASR